MEPIPIVAPDGRTFHVAEEDLTFDGWVPPFVVCVVEGEPVRADGCVVGGALVGCDGPAVDVSPSATLHEERALEIRGIAPAVLFLAWLPLAIVGAGALRWDLGLGFVRRIVRRERRRTSALLALGALPPLALAGAGLALGAYVPALVLVALACPLTAFLFSRARTLASLARGIANGADGTVAIEGQAGKRGGRRVELGDDADVAFDLVEILAETRLTRREIPSGGTLEIVTNEGALELDLLQVVPDLTVVREFELSALQIPRELAAEHAGGDCIVRRSVLRTGERVTLFGAGTPPGSAGRGAYRSATTEARLAAEAPVYLFDGPKSSVVARLRGRARRLDALNAVVLAVALAAAAWGLEIARLLGK